MSTEFPKRLTQKLKAIRKRHDLALTELLKAFDAKSIEAFESGTADLPLSVLYAYAKAAGVSLQTLLDDEHDL